MDPPQPSPRRFSHHPLLSAAARGRRSRILSGGGNFRRSGHHCAYRASAPYPRRGGAFLIQSCPPPSVSRAGCLPSEDRSPSSSCPSAARLVLCPPQLAPRCVAGTCCGDELAGSGGAPEQPRWHRSQLPLPSSEICGFLRFSIIPHPFSFLLNWISGLKLNCFIAPLNMQFKSSQHCQHTPARVTPLGTLHEPASPTSSHFYAKQATELGNSKATCSWHADFVKVIII